ncbi:MAG: TIGR02206 family membrane protein [Phycisphaeraceae bacterium]|nr:TIGR02206 family membrane protein [Phycisphaeraceae bacterium]
MYQPLAPIPTIPAPWWPADFQAFSALHALTVAILALGMGASCVLGRRWRGTAREWRLRVFWSTFTITWTVLATVWYFLPRQFDPMESWPLHVCDIAVWVAPLALLTQHRWLRTVLYFFGIGLSTQAFATPVVEEGPAGTRFWLFWVGHTQIVGSAIYDVVVLGYRPRFRDLLVAVGTLIAYAALVTPINLGFGVNYGYIGNAEPARETLVTRLGPWPWRLVPMFGLAVGVFVAAWGVWAVARLFSRRGRGGPDASDEGHASESLRDEDENPRS